MQQDTPRPSSALTWILTVVGAAMGAALLHFEAGFLVGAAFGFLFARLSAASQRIDALQLRLAWLEQLLESRTTAARPVAATPPPRPAAVETPVAPVAPVVAEAPAPVRPVSVPPPPPAPAAAEPIDWAATTQVIEPKPSLLQPWIDRGMDWLRGGNPLARVGILILFLGGAFLARYAAENSMFPIELRLAALAAGAIALLVTGWRLRESRAVYAQILQGGGVAGFYLTVFAATRLYHLLPPSLALGLMIAVALASALLAVAQESLSLAVIGFAGGFLAPVLLSTGGGSHVALFTYYTVLNLGVFTVAWFRAWRLLNLVGFVFTFGITGLWRATSYQPGDLASADFFLLLFWLMYVAVSVLFALRQPPKLKGYVSGSLVFGLPVIAATIHASLIREVEYGMAWSSLAFGGFYVALAWVLFRSGRDSLRLLAEAFAALGVIFASLAVPLAFDERATALMWAVEGAGLMWLGLRQQRPLARAFSILLQLAAAARYLGQYHQLEGELLFLNGAWLASAALAISALLSGWWAQRYADGLTRYEKELPLLAAIWGCIWWFLGGLAELDRHAPQDYAIGYGLGFLALSLLVLHGIGRRSGWLLLRRIALLLLPLAFLVGLSMTAQLHPLAQAGGLGWPPLLLIAWALLHRLDREPDEGLAAATPLLHASAAWSLVLLLAWEVHWQLTDTVPGVWNQLPWGMAPAALLALCAASRLRPAWPLARHEQTYRLWVALPLALLLALWILVINFASDGDPVWLPYLPLLNPLDLSLCIGLLVLLQWVLALTAEQRARIGWQDRRLPLAAIAALGFLTISAALLRALHHLYGTPLDAPGIVHSTFVQMALSIFWGLLGMALMLLATRRAWRKAWMLGAALMAVVVAKLFLLDLSGSGTLARIASFLGVGALLLLTGYLSPLPPAAQPIEEDHKPEPAA
ncbi:MAG TPA: DUF2339 domain-containing protein [Solimonas sp.]|nr:DUF2339 domain-containing protein [Solimonas sp.]